jgi:hypothetical protein
MVKIVKKQEKDGDDGIPQLVHTHFIGFCCPRSLWSILRSMGGMIIVD